MEYLYIYDLRKREIGKFKIIQETKKQYKIDYRTGIDLINSEKDYVWSNVEWIAKTEINAEGIYCFDKAVATNLKELKRMIMAHLIDFKKICYTLGNDENDDLVVVPKENKMTVKEWNEHFKNYKSGRDIVQGVCCECGQNSLCNNESGLCLDCDREFGG